MGQACCSSNRDSTFTPDRRVFRITRYFSALRNRRSRSFAALVARHDDGGLAADRGDPIGAPGDPCSSNAGRWLMARDIGTI